MPRRRRRQIGGVCQVVAWELVLGLVSSFTVIVSAVSSLFLSLFFYCCYTCCRCCSWWWWCCCYIAVGADVAGVVAVAAVVVVVVVAVVGLIAFAVALLVSVVFFCLFFHWSCVGCCSGCRRFIGMVVVDADVVRAVLCVVAPVGAPRKRSSRAYAGLALFLLLPWLSLVRRRRYSPMPQSRASVST